MTDKLFLDELIKTKAEKIASEKTDNLIAIVTVIGIFLVGFIVGSVTGSYFWIHNARQSVIQELCEKQQYDFCETSKIIYKIKDNNQK